MSGLLTRERLIVVAVIAVLAVAGGGTALALTRSSPSHDVSMPLAGRGPGRGPGDRAALKITSGTSVLHVSVARLAGTLLRVSIPDDAPVRPVLTGSAPILLSLTGDPGDRHAPYAVSVVLSSAVVWSLDFAGGTQLTTADLRGGQVGGIVVTAGSDTLAIALPRPAGTLSFLLAGGLSRFLLSLPGGVPARVTAEGGAAQITVDGQSRTGVAGGTVITAPGWATATSRLDIDAIAGFSRLTVSRW